MNSCHQWYEISIESQKRSCARRSSPPDWLFFMDPYDVVIITTLVGFFLLAYLLLFPVYRFLQKEERVSKQWTPEALAAKKMQAQSGDDGAPRVDASELPLN